MKKAPPPQKRSTPKAFGRRSYRETVTVRLTWRTGRSEPWVDVELDGITRTVRGNKALWELVLLLHGWEDYER